MNRSIIDRVTVMKSVRIIKRNETEIVTEASTAHSEIVDNRNSREIVKTVKSWIAELHNRRREEQLATAAFRKFYVTLSVIVLSILV